MKQISKRNAGNTLTAPTQEKRSIFTFEPANDVKHMLQRATENGAPRSFFINNALRDWLTAKGYAKKAR